MKVKVTGVEISHIWDGDSESKIVIKTGKFDDTGHYVSVTDGGETVYFRPDSWVEVRDQIQSMFDEIEGEQS